MRRYVAETLAGEAPYDALTPSRVDEATGQGRRCRMRPGGR